MTMSSPHPICVPLAALLMLCGASCKKPYTSETSQAPSHAAALCAGVEAGEPLRTCEELCTPRPASLECLVARRIGQPGLDALEQARAVPGEQRRAIYARVEGLPPMVEAYELGPWRSGPERAKVAEGREALGRCEVLVEDRPEESQRLCAQGVSQIEGILGKEHPMSAQARVTEALLHTRGERRAETLRAEREVLAALLGQDHPRTLAVEVALARARLDEVIEPGAELLAELEELAQAREIFFGDESAELHEALVARGVARMRAGQLERARQDLERADALLEAQGEPGYDPARLRAREPWAYVAPPAEVRAWAERAANAPDVPLEARAQVRMIAAQGMAHGGDLVGAQGMLGALQGRVDGAQSEGSALALRVRRARLDLARHAADWEAVLELSSALEAAGGSSPEDRAQALEAWLAGTEALTHLSRIESARERLEAFLNLLQQRGQSGQLTATELRQILPRLTSRALALEEYTKAVMLEQEALALADRRLREGNTETLVRVASLARTLGRVGRARAGARPDRGSARRRNRSHPRALDHRGGAGAAARRGPHRADRRRPAPLVIGLRGCSRRARPRAPRWRWRMRRRAPSWRVMRPRSAAGRALESARRPRSSSSRSSRVDRRSRAWARASALSSSGVGDAGAPRARGARGRRAVARAPRRLARGDGPGAGAARGVPA